VNQFHNSYFAY